MRRMFGDGGGQDYKRQQAYDDDQDSHADSLSEAGSSRPRALNMERPRSAWATGSSRDHGSARFEDVPIDDHQSSGSWGGDRSGPLKAAPVAAPPFQVVASQGYGHNDHGAGWVQGNPNSYPPHSSPSPYTPHPASPPRDPMPQIFVAPKKRRRAWLLPVVVLTACVIVFIVEMYVNNCPKNVNLAGSGARQQCVLRFLGRLSFQPLQENPLFGPSTAALLQTGALESDRVTSGQGWRLLTCMWLHAGVIHLVSNMLGIYYIGAPLEREFGPLKVGTIYLLSGFAGALLSANFLTNQVSVGASGALFGLIGATLAELIINWNRYANRIVAIITLLLVIAVNLILGLMPYVDNFAHIGGLLAGLLLGFVLLLKPRLEWEQHTMNPGPVISLPRRNTGCQHFTRILAAILLVALYIVALVLLFTGVDVNKECRWCHYMNCVPTSFWQCSNSTGARSVLCRAVTNPDGSGSMVCPNQKSTPVSSIGTLSDQQLQALCTQFCG